MSIGLLRVVRSSQGCVSGSRRGYWGSGNRHRTIEEEIEEFEEVFSGARGLMKISRLAGDEDSESRKLSGGWSDSPRTTGNPVSTKGDGLWGIPRVKGSGVDEG